MNTFAVLIITASYFLNNSFITNRVDLINYFDMEHCSIALTELTSSVFERIIVNKNEVLLFPSGAVSPQIRLDCELRLGEYRPLDKFPLK